MQRKRPDDASPPKWSEVKKGEKYIRKVRHSESGEWMEREITITGKRVNPTLDGSPGARILAVQFSSKGKEGSKGREV